MKCIVLAAGYATRLYPLTKNFPKPLLTVAGKTILDHLLDDIHNSGKVDEFIVVSNHVFYKHFEEWAQGKTYKVTLLDDGTTTNENRLGAVKDIAFAIGELSLSDDLLVIAGDNLLSFSLKEFLEYFERKNSSVIMRYFESDYESLKKRGVIEKLDGDRVLGMVEKSPEPPTNWCVPPFYIYKRDDLHLINEAIESGVSTDAPGSFTAWLTKKTVVNSWEMTGVRYDIGNIESYNKVKEIFEN